MAASFSVGDRHFGSGKALAVAEIGTGHGGDLAKARDLIAAAAESGADCVKFQCVFADEIIHPNTGLVQLPGGSIPLYDRFLELEEDEAFYASLKESAASRGLLFLCTPFGLRSSRLLRRIGCEALKVASPELNHFPLLDELASYGLPVILSSGVSVLGDIDRALDRFPGHRGADGAGIRGANGASVAADGEAVGAGLALLHCITSYPAPESEYNLRVLKSLGALFGIPVGVSDHSLDPVLVPALSIAAGGIIVEKHICLSRDDPGLDDLIALTPKMFAEMTSAVRRAELAGPEETIASLKAEFGDARVEAVLGDGVKRLAPSEADNYRRTNRSVHAMRAIKKGEVFAPDDLAILRTEKVLRVGLDPELLPLLLGRRAARDLPSGEGLEWADVGAISAER